MDVNDDPPLYEPPPSYEEVMKKEKEKRRNSSSHFLSLNAATTVKLPDSPPPPYKDDIKTVSEDLSAWAPFYENIDGAGPSSDISAKREMSLVPHKKPFDIRAFLGSVSCGLRDGCECAGACSCATARRNNFAATWSPATSHMNMNAIDSLLQNIHSQNQISDSVDGKSCVKGSISADNIFQAECM